MQKLLLRGAAIVGLAVLAGCGESLPEQALLGAGAGAGTAAVLNGSIATGALVGAAGNVAYCKAYPSRCR
jgi:hypothetical protein